ncbi:hypothetical protein KMW28_15465 [Flammeovirga yaeyamensis]|uniref:Uncharacterized protein n=1 Tax=Flammeovirga yaeyamensis TaxID=367791 RepID=A0AAX1N0Q5_9BACT|nr:hypothetical protein [Flammeovirga yaeyamensis]MBB3698589.1 Skp family chaperone for outer membrane proteins [Flammeovirga yaeyamensis]NMF34062.1 hypothetical protein [Flammeovirga yaeyamensis]QWG01050.1 hypothetical protein KMW28_15465 [Flammeovirga yaeyamensis]
MKKITLFVFTILSIFLFSFQDGPKKGMDKEARKKAQKEIAEYNKANVVPVLLENRKEFDNKLSDAEKKELASLRTRLDNLKEENKSMKKDKKKGEAPTEEQKAAKEAAQKEMRQIMTAAWAVVDNHEADLKSIKEANKANEEKWRTDMKAIMEKYRPEGSMKGEGKKKGHNKGKHKMGRNPMGANRDVMFVLMDPTKSVDEIAAQMEKMGKRRYGDPDGKGKKRRGHSMEDED